MHCESMKKISEQNIPRLYSLKVRSDESLMKSVAILLVLFLVSFQARAGTLVELGGTYISENLKTGSSSTSTRYFYNLGVLFSLKKRVWGGWNYSGFSQNDTGTPEIKISSMDTGPYMKWQFGRNEIYSASFAYNILSKATADIGNGSEEWRGTSFWLQLGFMPEVKDGLHLGASLNYYAASYNKSVINGTESNISYSKSWIFPLLSLTKEW